MEYDLWPLPWWQNPWVWTIIVGCFLVSSGIVWYLWRRRRVVVLRNPRLCLLQRVYSLQKYVAHGQVDSKYIYTELMCVIRDCCHLLFMVRFEGATDEELVTVLRNHAYADIPEQFLLLAEAVSDASCYAKFAAQSISPEQISSQISDCIKFIETYVDQKTSCNDKFSTTQGL